MSRLYEAFEKQKKDLVSAQPQDALYPNEAVSNLNGQRDSGAQDQASIVDLRPVQIDYSEELAGEIALLFRSLCIANQGQPGSLLLCGAERGTGTSTIALCLASHIAGNEGRRTLLVEADFQRPYLSGAGRLRKVGFLDLLSEQGAIGNYVSRTSSPGLDVMHAGRITETSGVLVTQKRVRYILDECKEEYAFILFDGAPISPSSTTLELAQAVDGVVMVARANVLADVVERAKTALENAKANVVGLIFNDF